MDIVECRRNRQAETGICNDVRGKSAIARKAGKERRIAQIFPSALAITAHAAGTAQPRHADPVSFCKSGRIGSETRNRSDNLMPGNNGLVGVDIAIDQMQIRATNAACPDRDKHVVALRNRDRPYSRTHRPTWQTELHHMHIGH